MDAAIKNWAQNCTQNWTQQIKNWAQFYTQRETHKPSLRKQ